ncbi:EamA/RhaT family transporter [Roseobacter denitrificans]|uniref:Integral membrane protein, putative n=1 Tax=Roseobacter denitrificans (strain ATCC 33942 / OCh 114) TaxID=375451 RepID=Q164E4_ROSDO|nr:DMT family transporter [Roseobacter denitrificans]ABG32649.1 integral membrane protein, putative [Roseobacter denitrificans OCh 114]AVL52084.1 EamA/RhaT family transporter [Roseobacter denitrificans]SFF93237.1 EamA-like transporter family protein [Roseobacter denitrificans OCh 114]
MDNLRGAALMVLAMLLFALEDMLIKLLAVDLPIGQIVGMLGLGSALLLAIVLKTQRQALFTAALLTPAIMLRAFGELVGTIGFVTAIALTPLSTASAILQATPLFVTLGAALFLQESVGWRRWTAIIVGFFGVMLIIRPGLEGFSWLSLFAVQGVIGLGIRDLATRRVPPETSSLQLSFWAFLVLIPAAGLMMWFNQTSPITPPPSTLLYFIAALLIGIFAYYCIVAAMRVGEISFVTPFRYSRILFALVIGISIFGERPDALTLLGAAIIVASGLYTLWRERRVRGGAH